MKSIFKLALLSALIVPVAAVAAEGFTPNPALITEQGSFEASQARIEARTKASQDKAQAAKASLQAKRVAIARAIQDQAVVSQHEFAAGISKRFGSETLPKFDASDVSAHEAASEESLGCAVLRDTSFTAKAKRFFSPTDKKVKAAGEQAKLNYYKNRVVQGDCEITDVPTKYRARVTEAATGLQAGPGFMTRAYQGAKSGATSYYNFMTKNGYTGFAKGAVMTAGALGLAYYGTKYAVAGVKAAYNKLFGKKPAAAAPKPAPKKRIVRRVVRTSAAKSKRTVRTSAAKRTPAAKRSAVTKRSAK